MPRYQEVQERIRAMSRTWQVKPVAGFGGSDLLVLRLKLKQQIGSLGKVSGTMSRQASRHGSRLQNSPADSLRTL